jgi:hypothetical protein
VAVVFSQGMPGRSIHFLDLSEVESNRGQNLSTLHSAESVVSMELIPNQAAALVVHDHYRTAMSILDLDDRTLSPFTAHSALAAYTINHNGEVLVGFTAGDDRIGIVDLSNQSAARPIQLSFAPSKVLAMGKAAGGEDDLETHTIVVDHGGKFGLITVIPHPLVAESEDIFVLSGFMVRDLLEERHD